MAREVGRPELNQGFNQARQVPVAHDKPRLNDKRKVRPHAAGQPAMGIRPSGGQQYEPKAPPIAKDRMEMRDVPVKLMTEEELFAEFSNPMARFFKSRQKIVPGDAIGYQVTAKGIRLDHVRNGNTVASVNRDSHESISQKLEDLNKQYKDLKQLRRELSINPKRAAMRMAQDYANEIGIRPSKIGELNREVPTNAPGGGQQAASPAAPGPTPAANRGNPTPAGPGGNPARGNAGPGGTPLGGQAPAGNLLLRRRPVAPGPSPGGSPGGSPPSPPPASTPTAAPEAPPEGPRGKYEDLGTGGTTPEDMKSLLLRVGYDAKTVANMTPWQIEQAYNRTVGGGSKKKKPNPGAPTAMAAESVMYENRGHVGRTIAACREMGMRCSHDPSSGEFRVNHPHNREETAYYTNDHEDAVGTARHMKAHSMSESYPEATVDHREEPSHSSKIGGNLRAQHHAPDPGKPDLNREFAQFRDLHIEKVEEQADRRMTSFLDRFTVKMGYDPVNENRDRDVRPSPASNDRIPRQRHRWI